MKEGLRNSFHSAIVIYFILATPLLSQQNNDPVSIGIYKKIHSEILNEDRLLSITLPREYESANLSYPVIYHLYGDRIEQYYSESVSHVYNLGHSGKIPPCIIVGIDEKQLRYRDLLPLNSDGTETGIENFVRYVKDEVFTFINQNYRTKDYRILVGPQVGANFGIYTLCKYPDMFNAFILTSPFRWSGGRDLLLEMSRQLFAQNKKLNKFLAITYDDADPLAKEGGLYVKSLEKIVNESKPENFRLKIDFIEKSSDFNTPLKLKEGLESLFESYSFSEDVQINNFNDIILFYRKLSDQYGFSIDAPEHVLTVVSDKFSEQKKINEQLEVLKYILELYPKSLNALIRFANYYKSIGEKQKAIYYFEECLKIMPDLEIARRNINMLKDKS